MFSELQVSLFLYMIALSLGSVALITDDIIDQLVELRNGSRSFCPFIIGVRCAKTLVDNLGARVFHRGTARRSPLTDRSELRTFRKIDTTDFSARALTVRRETVRLLAN